jgi:hypothetical protein
VYKNLDYRTVFEHKKPLQQVVHEEQHQVDRHLDQRDVQRHAVVEKADQQIGYGQQAEVDRQVPRETDAQPYSRPEHEKPVDAVLHNDGYGTRKDHGKYDKPVCLAFEKDFDQQGEGCDFRGIRSERTGRKLGDLPDLPKNARLGQRTHGSSDAAMNVS